MFFLQSHQTAAQVLARFVPQPPLRFEYGGGLRTGVEASDGQLDLHLRRETFIGRAKHQALGIQLPSQLPQQQLLDIGLQTAGPTGLLNITGQTTVSQTLKQCIAL